MPVHQSMLDGAIHSACDTGKITPEQRDEFLSLMLAFDAFVEAAVPNKPSEFLYHSEQFRESHLPEYAFMGDINGCTGQVNNFLHEHALVCHAGSAVRLQDIQARPELNGKYGQLRGADVINNDERDTFDPSTGRWPIQVDVEGSWMKGRKEALKLKLKNLRPASLQDILRQQILRAQQQDGGGSETAAASSNAPSLVADAAAAYSQRLAKEVSGVLPGVVSAPIRTTTFAPQQAVVISGLSGRAELNGLVAEVLGDMHSDRYPVRVLCTHAPNGTANGECVRIKPANLLRTDKHPSESKVVDGRVMRYGEWFDIQTLLNTSMTPAKEFRDAFAALQPHEQADILAKRRTMEQIVLARGLMDAAGLPEGSEPPHIPTLPVGLS